MTRQPTSSGSLDVTQITAPAAVGGLEQVVAMLATGLAGRGHRSRVVALHGVDPRERCHAFAGIEAEGVELIELRTPPRRYGRERRRVAEILRAASGTVAHCHGYHADLVGWLAARAARRPVIATVHGYTGGDRKNRVYEWLDGIALRRMDRVVAVARPLADRLARDGVRDSRLVVLVNAWRAAGSPRSRLEARRALGIPEDGLVIGWVGRLSPEKGPDLFLDAVSRLPATYRASVVGDGAMRAGLVARAHRLGLADRVRWHGTVPEAGRLLPAFDVLALSSRTEGTPIVLLEAMAAGVPVVATAVGGVPDVVPAGEAWLVPPGNPAALAAAILECGEREPEARARLAAARSRVAEAYAPGPWLDRYEAIYRSVACR